MLSVHFVGITSLVYFASYNELLRVNLTFFVLSCLAILVVVTKGSIQFKDSFVKHIKFLILLVSCLLPADNYEIGLCI